MSMRQRLIGAGFGVIGATRLHRLAAPWTRGLGAILMFHHVRPARRQPFDPNGLLSITPGFLDAVLTHLRQSGHVLLTLDQMLERLRAGPRRGARPFAVLTFDDGYRDNRDFALPILERHHAPATFYVTTGFADRTARLWWLELEEVVRASNRISVTIANQRVRLPAGTPAEKAAAFQQLYWRLRRGPEEDLLATIELLCREQGIDGRALVERECLDWAGIGALAGHPLVTIGAHTLSHPMLAKHDEARVRYELVEARTVLQTALGRPVRHVAYPVGDRTSAGPRDFALAREAGYDSAVTTRPGLVYPGHAPHVTALPRVSVNGNHQKLGSLDVLLSGAAFALWNRGRFVDAA